MKKSKLHRLGIMSLLSIAIAAVSVNSATASDFYTIQDKALRGDMTAQYNMGSMYSIGEGVPQDYNQAFNWFEKAAKQGHIESAHNIGLLYEKGRGAPKDYKQAVNWYKRAAAAGYGDSQLNLGVMYSKGIGVERDVKKAIELFKTAAKNSNGTTPEKAKYNLGLIYTTNYNIK